MRRANRRPAAYRETTMPSPRFLRLGAIGTLAALAAGCVAVPGDPYYDGGGYYPSPAPAVTVYERPGVIYSQPVYVPPPRPVWRDRDDWRERQWRDARERERREAERHREADRREADRRRDAERREADRRQAERQREWDRRREQDRREQDQRAERPNRGNQPVPGRRYAPTPDWR